MYLVFGGECYYAAGGANDWIETHKDKEQAIKRAVELIGTEICCYKGNPNEEWDPDRDLTIEWTHVFNAETNGFVYKSDNRAHSA